MNKKIQKADTAITAWMSKYGLLLLRVSIGIVFFWFGFLKFFEGLSPAEGIAIRTIDKLAFHLFSEKVIIYGLAVWEVGIGIGLLLNVFMRITLLLLFLQMIGTFTPLFLFPSEVFHVFPYSLTLEGQYIIKNIIIISAGIVLGANIRGSKLAA
ncbi:MAG: DUF417 family protein [Bacteroidales bacterium]|nr:DUF417 family protein [Bacteroidales bacterium]MBN2762420.1 DUF417 family protein [Bacteroidales bacterium]